MNNNRTKREFWARGRRGCAACIEAIEYENGSVTASAEGDKITDAQLRKALSREFPDHTFYAHRRDGYVYAQADPCGELVLAAG